MIRRRTRLPAVLFMSGILYAQNSDPLSGEIKQAYENVKKNLLRAADKVPEADYSFKPTPEVRTFGEVLQHVIMAQSHTCPAIAGTEIPKSAPVSNKAEIVAALKQSFEACDRAYNSLTDSNAVEMLTTPRGKRTRLGALAGNTTHDTEQYAILSVYMRLKGIVPPSSEK